jgi:steroid delta-isomerase-like uncharacterized protein
MTRDDVVAVLAQRQEAVARRQWAAFRKLYADDARLESPLAGSVEGPDAIANATDLFFVAFPDAIIVSEPPIVDGDRAVVIAEVTGSHVGAIMGLPPSGRAFRLMAAFVFGFRNGRIVEERRVYDFTGLLVQIGVLKAKPA